MRPFLQGKKASPATPLKLASSSCALPHGPAAGKAARLSAQAQLSPHVEVVKEGDKVTRLIITCGCGERIEVNCLYPAGG